jgi:ribosomal protein S18 acetylase RimI-like enzyme
MRELKNERGEVCACIDPVKKGNIWAIVVSWKKGVGGLPDGHAWDEALKSAMTECVMSGAVPIESRVITASEDVDEGLASSRAAMHRDSLAARGFKQRESRVEYRMDLGEAVAALESQKIVPMLSWECVEADHEAGLARAADLFRKASEGDPAGRSEDDALGFLKGLLEEEETSKSPRRIQIGTYCGAPAAVLALMSFPGDGWSTVYYLGVLPAFRGRGFGREAMLHAFRCLKAMGGKIYQDGTGATNAAARALFALLGRPPFRAMEEWRLEKPS